MSAPFEVPGHTWDPVKKRFFKSLPEAKRKIEEVNPRPGGMPDLMALRTRGRMSMPASRQFARDSIRALYSRLEVSRTVSLRASAHHSYKGQDEVTSLCVDGGAWMVGMRNEDIWRIQDGVKQSLALGRSDANGRVAVVNGKVITLRAGRVAFLDGSRTAALGKGDINAFNISGEELAVGIGKSAVYLDTHLRVLRKVKTPSDVMALCAGAIGLRSGLVLPYDISGQGGAVTNLARVSETELLVAWSDGNMALFDLTTRRPKVSLKGHVNEYTQGLVSTCEEGESKADEAQAFGVDSEYRVVAAAGQDGTLRVWTLEREEPLMAIPFERTPMALAWTPDTPPGLLVASGCEVYLYQ